MTTIYHNPRCSKSRETLALLLQQGLNPDVVLYLETPPDASQLATLIARLGLASARELLRKGEAEYQALNLDDAALSDAEIIAAMVAHPRLIERPIVVHGECAVIGRPPEKILTIL